MTNATPLRQGTPAATPPLEDWYCAECGSQLIRHDAEVRWDRVSQCYEVLAVMDDPTCAACCLASCGADTGRPVFAIPPAQPVSG